MSKSFTRECTRYLAVNFFKSDRHGRSRVWPPLCDTDRLIILDIVVIPPMLRYNLLFVTPVTNASLVTRSGWYGVIVLKLSTS